MGLTRCIYPTYTNFPISPTNKLTKIIAKTQLIYSGYYTTNLYWVLQEKEKEKLTAMSRWWPTTVMELMVTAAGSGLRTDPFLSLFFFSLPSLFFSLFSYVSVLSHCWLIDVLNIIANRLSAIVWRSLILSVNDVDVLAINTRPLLVSRGP